MTDQAGHLSLADMAPLFDAPESPVQETWYLHAAFVRWILKAVCPTRIAGIGPAFEGVRAMALRLGFVLKDGQAADDVDLLILDGPLDDRDLEPDRWLALLKRDAIVLINGIHPGYRTSVLWRNWSRSLGDAASLALSHEGGFGLLALDPARAPRSVSTLLAASASEKAAFAACCAATSRFWRAEQRQAAADALVARLRSQVALLQREKVPVWHERQLSAPRRQLEADRAAPTGLEASTTWKVATGLQIIGRRLPPFARNTLRRGARVIWWTVTGQLRTRLRARRAGIAGTAPAAAASQPAGTAAGESQQPRPAATHRERLLGLDIPAETIFPVTVGVAAGDASPTDLCRAIAGMQAALALLGPRCTTRVIIANSDAEPDQTSALPSSVDCMPVSGGMGFAATHNRLMAAAFAASCEIYVVASPRGVLDVGAIVALVRQIRAERRRAVIEATGGHASEHDGNYDVAWISDVCFAIPRAVHDAVGAFDETLDACETAIDFAWRARRAGFAVKRSPEARVSVQPVTAVEAFEPEALRSRLRLARKWQIPVAVQELEQVLRRFGQPLGDLLSETPSQPFDVDQSAFKTTFALWSDCVFRAIVGATSTTAPLLSTSQEGRPPLPAILPPPELDRCLEIPLGVTTQRTDNRSAIAAIVHLFYEDLADEVCTALQNIPFETDIFITTDTEQKRQHILNVFATWPRGTVTVMLAPNRGRDIAPKLVTFAKVHEHYDYVLHLHGKKTTHWARGEEWRRYIYRTLLGSPEIVRSIFEMFDNHARLGIVLPQHWPPVRSSVGWGYSFQRAGEVGRRVGVRVELGQPLDFPSGSMFWARSKALAPLLQADLTAEDFPEEGFRYGSLADAIERLYLRACEHAGYVWLKVAAIGEAGIEPPPTCVSSPSELAEYLETAPYLLSDPALQKHVSHPVPRFRFVPDLSEVPRYTYLCSALSLDTESGADLLRQITPEDDDMERRVVSLDAVAVVEAGVPPPLAVRADEIFVASVPEAVAAAAELRDMQRAFFGRAWEVLRPGSVDDSGAGMPARSLAPRQTGSLR